MRPDERNAFSSRSASVSPSPSASKINSSVPTPGDDGSPGCRSRPLPCCIRCIRCTKSRPGNNVHASSLLTSGSSAGSATGSVCATGSAAGSFCGTGCGAPLRASSSEHTSADTAKSLGPAGLSAVGCCWRFRAGFFLRLLGGSAPPAAVRPGPCGCSSGAPSAPGSGAMTKWPMAAMRSRMPASPPGISSPPSSVGIDPGCSACAGRPAGGSPGVRSRPCLPCFFGVVRNALKHEILPTMTTRGRAARAVSAAGVRWQDRAPRADLRAGARPGKLSLLCLSTQRGRLLFSRLLFLVFTTATRI